MVQYLPIIDILLPISVDGYSGMIITIDIMPIKNNITIYENIFKGAVEKYGLFDQIRLDTFIIW